MNCPMCGELTRVQTVAIEGMDAVFRSVDTCSHGQVKPGHTQCSACERDAAELAALRDEINDDIENDTSQGRWKVIARAMFPLFDEVRYAK